MYIGHAASHHLKQSIAMEQCVPEILHCTNANQIDEYMREWWADHQFSCFLWTGGQGGQTQWGDKKKPCDYVYVVLKAPISIHWLEGPNCNMLAWKRQFQCEWWSAAWVWHRAQTVQLACATIWTVFKWKRGRDDLKPMQVNVKHCNMSERANFCVNGLSLSLPLSPKISLYRYKYHIVHKYKDTNTNWTALQCSMR